MRILLKCPTRSRSHRVMKTLEAYVKLANCPEKIGVAISCDRDDATMSRNIVHDELHRILKRTAWHRIFTGDNHSKIEACNSNMDEIDWEWDVVVLISDDMIPQVQGYDDVIRTHMMARFPNTDGILWCNDGYQGDKLNTLSILGRKMYDRFGYIYNPEYKSLFCDTEFTDLCKGELKEKCTYLPYCIIRHEHPGAGFVETNDELYSRNQLYFAEDANKYIERKKYPYDMTFLIPTITGRDGVLSKLVSSIHEKIKRLAPNLTYRIEIEYDNREMTIGAKRQKLLQSSKGKYTVFIDDDDDITDAYIEDLSETIAGSYQVMRLRGRIDPYTFTHSVDITMDSPMAIGDVFVRPPNHLNPVLTDLAKVVHYTDRSNQEDFEWSIRMAQSGLLTREFKSDESRIHYLYNLGQRNIVASNTLAKQRETVYRSLLSPVPQPSPSSNGPALRLTPRGFVSK